MPFQTGAILDRTTPRIATSGALTIGVKLVPPMPPRLEIVKHAPCMSVELSLPSRARFDALPSSLLSSWMPLRSTSRMTGTTSPSGVSAAMPIW